MKNSFSSEKPSPSKVVIVPKPPKSQSSDSTDIPNPVKSVLKEEIIKDAKDGTFIPTNDNRPQK